jgi:hypothetical protein
MSFSTQTQNRQNSFPELVGRSAEDAVAYLSAQGIIIFLKFYFIIN